jgi:tetratricopeptide (TPR) repeat protein
MHQILDQHGTDSALKFLKIQETKYGRSAPILSLYGNLYDYEFKDDSAKVYFNKSLQEGMNNPFVLNYYAEYISQFSIDSAFYYYGKVLKIDKNFVEAYVGIGRLNMGLNKFDEAIKNFKEIAERHAYKYEIYIRIALCYSLKNDKDSTKLYLDKIPENFTTDFNHFLLDLNILPLEFSDDKTSFNFLSRFLNKEPKTKYDCLLRAKYYFRIKDFQKAKEYFYRFADNTELNEYDYYFKLQVLNGLKDYKELKIVCEIALNKFPANYKFYELYALNLFLNRNDTEAFKYINLAIDKNDSCITCYVLKSKIAGILKKSKVTLESIDLALELYNKKSEKIPDDTTILNQILLDQAASYYFFKKEIKYCEEYLSKYRDDELILNCLFYYYFPKMNIEKLSELVNKLEKIEFLSKSSLHNLGLFYTTQEKPEKANYYLLKYLTLDSALTGIYNLIATNYLKQKDKDNSLKYFLKAVQGNPNDDNSYYNLACIYSIQYKSNEAITNLRKAILLNSSLKINAKEDPDFNNIKETDDFKNLIR